MRDADRWGAEVLQTNVNLNVTEGVVFQKLQPFTHTGVAMTTALSDSLTLVTGVVNEVYRDTNISVDRDKAGIAQIKFAGDGFGLNVGAIVGQVVKLRLGPAEERRAQGGRK